MAASGSDSVEFAPTHFPVSFSHDALNTQISVAIERCQLCLGGKRCFYCINCLNAGDFVHSNSNASNQNAQLSRDSKHSDKDRYKDKLDLWEKLKRQREDFGNRATAASGRHLLLEEKRNQVYFVRQKNELLRKAISEAREKLVKEKEYMKKLSEENRQRKSKSNRHSEKTKRILQYIDKSVKQTSTSQSHLDSLVSDLVSRRRQHVRDLVNLIFPITIVQSKSASESDNGEDSTIGLLAEARHTSYVKGRWVYTDNGGEQQYSVVHPSLPGNGDYSAYPVWLLSNRHVLSGPECDLQLVNPAFTVGAALQYTSQLVGVLACLLDVNLPHRLAYGDFGKELSEERFYQLVYRLNSNVLQLCFSQSVDPDKLQAHHTIQNVLGLLNAQHLGRSGPFCVAAELMQSFEESQLCIGQDEEEISDGEDLRDGGEIEWEQVPSSLPEADIPHSFYSSAQLSRRGSESQLGASTTHSLAGGFMSGAAALGSSLWRYTWSPRPGKK